MNKNPTTYASLGVLAFAVAVVCFSTSISERLSYEWKHPQGGDRSYRLHQYAVVSSLLAGKTEAQVIELLGEPDSRGTGICGIETLGPHDYITYSMEPKDFSYTWKHFAIEFRNGKVTKTTLEGHGY